MEDLINNKNYYIVRHGQTVWNLEKRKQGQKDSPLTLKGIEQAHKVASALNNENLDDFSLITSPLGRCRQFCNIICEDIGFEYKNCIIEEDLKEHCFGLWEGMTEEEIEKGYPGFLEERYIPENYWNYTVPMGESYNLIYKRAKKLISKYDKLPRNKSVIFICHEMISKVIRGNLLGLEQGQILNSGHPQDVIYKFSNNKILEIQS